MNLQLFTLLNWKCLSQACRGSPPPNHYLSASITVLNSLSTMLPGPTLAAPRLTCPSTSRTVKQLIVSAPRIFTTQQRFDGSLAEPSSELPWTEEGLGWKTNGFSNALICRSSSPIPACFLHMQENQPTSIGMFRSDCRIFRGEDHMTDGDNS